MTEEGLVETGEDGAEARVGAEGVESGLADQIFDCFDEEVEASDWWNVQRQRHSREGHRE